MVLKRSTTRTFHRRLYAGELEKITLLKRDPGQRSGVRRAITLFQCRRSRVSKSGQDLQGDMTSNHRTVWHIPRVELDRVGVAYLSNLDQIVQTIPQERNWTWQPESDVPIDVKLFGNMVSVACKRCDPFDPTIP